MQIKKKNAIIDTNPETIKNISNDLKKKLKIKIQLKNKYC